MSKICFTLLLLIWTISSASIRAEEPAKLPGTKQLTAEGDIAAQMVAGVDKFLLRKIDESVEKRAQYWKHDFSSPEAYNKSIEPNRQRLAKMLGVVDERVEFDAPELVATTNRSAVVLKADDFTVYAVRWPVLSRPRSDTPSIYGEGLLCVPNEGKPEKDVIVLGDADQSPEDLLQLGLRELIGDSRGDERSVLLDELNAKASFKQGLTRCRVIIPTLISREMSRRNGRANLTNREYLYRPSFELGRHLAGYEVQKVLSCVDWFTREAGSDEKAQIGISGYGEGGLLALYAAAIDPRIDMVEVGGCFNSRKEMWREPIDRNLFGFLTEFGGAELVDMVLPRKVAMTFGEYPTVELPSEGGAPGTLKPPSGEAPYVADVVRETDRIVGTKHFPESWKAVHSQKAIRFDHSLVSTWTDFQLHDLPDAVARQQRQIDEIDRHNQALLAESPYVRKERFWNKLDYSSAAAFEKSVAPFRGEFKHDVIGHFDDEPLPFNARTRKAYDEEKWVGYEVMIDLWPDVFCYGVLCLPKDLSRDGNERRPVAVCQHGLEGRPQDIVAGDHPAYHDFASKLCERGFITFSPQNLYIGRDKFRTLQRKANPLGKTLFSIITPQHQQIIDWLKTQPYVDAGRIGFYGLSYGGKTAMRVPPLVDDYKCVICSADFNDWVWKNASTRAPYSYVWTGEYEIFEWNLGHTFNYAEMAALIAPRPFMVERGHFDGVAPDERVAYEFAKVQHLYQARLKLPADHCQIEWFAGPHTINGKGTFAFLHQRLEWPEPGLDEERREIGER